MSSGVKKHCSILHYLENVDSKLTHIIQHLCIGRKFTTKKDTGLTFLRPSSELSEKIIKMATGDDPEQAIKILESMLIPQYITNLDEFVINKDAIVTLAGGKIPIGSSDGKGVKVNGTDAVIEVDNNFQSRDDRKINVFMLSGGFYNDKLNATGGNEYFRSSVKGGADLGDGSKRSEIFDVVIKATAETTRNTEPAMEILVEMYLWAETTHKELLSVIGSNCGYDALTSLAIVLQPYKNKPTYLTDQHVKEFVNYLYADGSFKSNDTLFCLAENPSTKYDEIRSKYMKKTESFIDDRDQIMEKTNRYNIISNIKEFYANKNTSNQGLRENSPPALLLAEGELRVLACILFDNHPSPSCQQLHVLYKDQCNLNEPYMFTDSILGKNTLLSFLHSTVFLLLKSDSLYFYPNSDGINISNLTFTNDEEFVSIDKTFETIRASNRDASQNNVNNLLSRIRKR